MSTKVRIFLTKLSYFSCLHFSVILAVAISDLIYGCIVSPFFVENYIRLSWDQGVEYCRFFTYYFTFHDLFAPLCLIALSCYISLKFTGETQSNLPVRLTLSWQE